MKVQLYVIMKKKLLNYSILFSLLQVADIKETMGKEGVSLQHMLAISRDNPKVMQSMSRKLVEEASLAGNPHVVDLPCFLHPVHTSFQKLVEALDTDIWDFLVNVHSFFKVYLSISIQGCIFSI